jgi:hypothetical protein
MTTQWHTPDFFVIRRNAAGFEEWKTASAVEGLTVTMPERYVRHSAGGWRYRIQDREVSRHMQQELAATWSKHKEVFVQALERRMRERSASLQKPLALRAEKEQRDIRSILIELQQSIRNELQQPEVVQLQLGIVNHRNWRASISTRRTIGPHSAVIFGN